jgi:hypothetical protein
MPDEIRRATRVYPKDFVDYSVKLEYNDAIYTGFLGNISETGLCGILPQTFIADQNDVVDGSLVFNPLKDEIPISGKIVWKTDYNYNNDKYVMIGMHFVTPITLPEYLMALTMSVDE